MRWALSLKDSAPGFDPLSAIGRYDDLDEDEVDFSETEQVLLNPREVIGLRRVQERTDMPAPAKGARLGGSAAHQRLILANLASQLFEHGRS